MVFSIVPLFTAPGERAGRFNLRTQTLTQRAWNIKGWIGNKGFFRLWEMDNVMRGWTLVYGLLMVDVFLHGSNQWGEGREILGVALLFISVSGVFTLNNFDVQLTLMVSYSVATVLGFLCLVLSGIGPLILNAVISISVGGLVNLVVGVRRDYTVFVTSFDAPELGTVTNESARLRAGAMAWAIVCWAVLPISATVANDDFLELVICSWLSYLLVLLSARIGVHTICTRDPHNWFAEIVLAGTTVTWTNELSALVIAVVNAYYARGEASGHVLTAVAFFGFGLRLGYITEVGVRKQIDQFGGALAPIGHVVFLRPGFARNSREIGSASGGHLAARLDRNDITEQEIAQYRQISMSMYVKLKAADIFQVGNEDAKADIPDENLAAWFV